MNRLITVIHNLSSRADESPLPAGSRSRKHWIILILGVIAAVYTALALGQDCTWDVINYHFYSGYALLAKPLNYDFAPAQVQSFFNPLQHVLSYLLLANLPSIGAAVILATVQGLNFYLVFQICQAIFREWPDPFRFLICLLSSVTGCYSSVYILELGTTFGDSLISIFILSGLLLIFHHLTSHGDKDPPSSAGIGISGALLGAALGLKFTAAVYIAAISLSLCATVLLTRRRIIRPLLIFFVFLGLSFAAVYGFWGYSLFHEYQNPIFPYMNRIFHSPFYDDVNLGDARFFARNWQQRYFYPFFFAQKNSLVSEMPFRDIRFALCYAALVLMAGVGFVRMIRRRARTGNKACPRLQDCPALLLLALFFPIAYLLWQNQFSIYRYLIVLELLAPAFLALVLGYFIRKRFYAFLGSLIINAGICALMIPADFGRQKFDDNFLRTEIPIFRDVDRSVVIMSGLEGTSFIIPNFPPETRFIRISSNFYSPGQNMLLDNKIRGILAKYDPGHTLVLISEKQDRKVLSEQLNFYGVKVDEQSCRPVLRRVRDVGFICGTAADSIPAQEIPPIDTSSEPAFEELPGVRMEINPKVVTKSTLIHLRIFGQKHPVVDLLYTINGELQPPQKKFFLDRDAITGFPVDSKAPKGLYHFIGIRSSAAEASEPWVRVDARVLLR